MGEVDGAGSRSKDGAGQEVWVETVGSQLADHGTEESCGIASPSTEALGRLEKLVASICVLTSMKYVGFKSGHFVCQNRSLYQSQLVGPGD